MVLRLCSFVWTTWSLWICFVHSGSVALIVVQQPPVVSVALGHDAVLPCNFQASLDEKIEATPVLYWSDKDKSNLLKDEKYAGRVHRLDQNQDSLNKSIVLKRVRWSDGQEYECKLSITSHGKSFRKKGNRTKLVIYDAMTFNLSSHNDSLLRCKVNVTQESGFVLSVTQDGRNLQTSKSDADDLGQTKARLSQTVNLKNTEKGNYRCELRLGKDLIMENIFHIDQPDGGAEKKENASCSLTSADSCQYPEPWILYTSLVLVQTLILLVLLIVTVNRRYCN